MMRVLRPAGRTGDAGDCRDYGDSCHARCRLRHCADAKHMSGVSGLFSGKIIRCCGRLQGICKELWVE
jgi:hypothetical protein